MKLLNQLQRPLYLVVNWKNSDLSRTFTYTPGSNYPGLHIMANPYTAAMDITKLIFTKMEETVYLYNTGSTGEWSIFDGTSGNNPGQYIAVPKSPAGQLEIPGQIPSMQGFMVAYSPSYSGGGSISVAYNNAVTKKYKLTACFCTKNHC